MSNSDKRIVILTDDELRETLSRLTFEIVDNIPDEDDLNRFVALNS